MTKIKNAIWPVSISSKSIFGLLAGLATWIALAYFQRPDGYSPLISVMVILMVSNSFDRRYLTLSGAIIGMVGGMVVGFQVVLQNISEINLLNLLVGVFGVGISVVIWGASVAFLGFLLATIANQYRRGAIL